MKRNNQTPIIFILICLNAIVFLFWFKGAEGFQATNTIPYDGVVYYGDLKVLAQMPGTLYIIDTKTGLEVWNKTLPLPPSGFGTYAVIGTTKQLTIDVTKEIIRGVGPDKVLINYIRVTDNANYAGHYINAVDGTDFMMVDSFLIQPKTTTINSSDFYPNVIQKLTPNIIPRGGTLTFIDTTDPTVQLVPWEDAVDTTRKYLFISDSFKIVQKNYFDSIIGSNPTTYKVLYPTLVSAVDYSYGRINYLNIDYKDSRSVSAYPSIPFTLQITQAADKAKAEGKSEQQIASDAEKAAALSAQKSASEAAQAAALAKQAALDKKANDEALAAQAESSNNTVLVVSIATGALALTFLGIAILK